MHKFYKNFVQKMCKFGCLFFYFVFYHLVYEGATRTQDAKELMFARQSIVIHCKAYGLQAIDMVHIDYKGVNISTKLPHIFEAKLSRKC